MKRIEIMFFILSIMLTVFLYAHYMSGLYYDQDVAFYANGALEILRGKNLYSTYNWGNKPPGINLIFLLAFYFFGESFIGIQTFSLIAKLLSVILLYLLAKRILAKEVKFYFLLPLFYALFSSSEAIQANTPNLEVFSAPFEIAGILFLGLATQNKKYSFYFYSGFVLGLGFLIKQTVLATCLAGLVFIFAIHALNRETFYTFFKKALFFMAVFLIPLLSILLYFLFFGLQTFSLNQFFIKNIAYLKNAASFKNIYLLWSMQQIWKGLKIEIIIFGLFSLLGIFYSFQRCKNFARLLALCWFMITTFVISKAGFHLRHHFIIILAPVLTLSVIGISDVYNLLVSLLPKKRFFSKISLYIGIAILVFPYFRIIAPLVKKHKLADSFLLTQRYLNSANKEEYVEKLLDTYFDGARRFLISQYVKEHTTTEDKIFVWDGLASGSINLWAQRSSAINYLKFLFLPKELWAPCIFTNRIVDYARLQRALLKFLRYSRPAYIIVVQSRVPMPDAPSSYTQLFLEKKEFKEFFDLLESDYRLEKQIYGCFAYRLKS